MALTLAQQHAMRDAAAKRYPGWTLDVKSGRLTPPSTITHEKLIQGFMVRAWKDIPAAMGAIVLPEQKAYKADEPLVIAGTANQNIEDRCHDIVVPTGGDFKNYLKNSVLLYQHQHDWPLGLVTSLSVADSGVDFEGWAGDPKAAPLTQLQNDCRSLIIQRILKAVSIGFIPLEIRQPTFDDQGAMVEPWTILRWELLELSVVAVPANPGSLFEAQGKAATVYAPALPPAAAAAPPAPTPERKHFPAAVPGGSVNSQPKKGADMDPTELKAALTGISDGVKALLTGQGDQAKALEKLLNKAKTPTRGDDNQEPDEDDDEDDKPAKALKALTKTVETQGKTLTALTDNLTKLTEAMTKLAPAPAA